MGGGSEWQAKRSEANPEARDYDYFAVKSSFDLTSQLFPGPSPAATLEQHQNGWWGYRRSPP